MKKNLLLLLLGFLSMLASNRAMAQSVSSTYNAGDIATKYAASSTIVVDLANECAATQTLTIPAGYQVTSVATSYNITALNNNYMGQQRSVLTCTTCNNGAGTYEGAVTWGDGTAVGTDAYNRTNLPLANGETGTVTFALKAWRVNQNGGVYDCNTTYQKVDNNSWTVTVYYGCAQPAQPVAAAQSFCSGTNPTVASLTATGTTLNWYNTPTAGTPLALTTPLVTGTYYVTQTSNSCESDRAAVPVTLTGIPQVATTQTFCGNATVNQLMATFAEGTTHTWSATPTGANLPTSTPLVTGTYYLTQTYNGCTSAPTAVSVQVNTTPPPVAAAQTFCAGATASQLTSVTGEGAIVVYYWSLDYPPVQSTTPLATGTYYAVQTLNNCVSQPTAFEVTVTTTPAPTASAQIFCDGATVNQLMANYADGATYSWSATLGGEDLPTSTPLATGTYYVTQTINGCTSVATTVAVTVNFTPAPAATAQTFCGGATVNQLTASTANGATVSWYTSLDQPALTPTTPLATGTYHVVQLLNNCVSQPTAFEVTVTTTSVPDTEALFLCEGATVSELVVGIEDDNAIINWYTTPGGTALESTTLVSAGTYYVTQTLNNCESAAVAVGVTINAIPDAPTGQTMQTFTQGETVSDLNVTTLTGAELTWYIFNDGDYQYIEPNTALQDGVTYYVSQSVYGCPSSYLQITASTVAGSGTFTFSGLKVYPNPATDVITVTNNAAISLVTVTNLLGQTVLSQANTADTAKINVAALAQGTYILRVYSAGAAATVKIVKQ